MWGPRPEKMPLPAVHDLPVEPPTGPAPRSPLGALLVAIGAFLLVLVALWIIDRFDDRPSSDPRLEVTTAIAPCPVAVQRRSRCYAGVVVNRTNGTLSLRCIWTPGHDTTIEVRGAPPTGIGPNATTRTTVAVVRGEARPSFECRVA